MGKKYVWTTMLINHNVEGTLQSSLDCPALRDLESTWLVSPVVKPGQDLPITRDLASAPAYVYQVHADYDKCLEDIATIEKLERTGLFDVESAKPSISSIFKDVDQSGISSDSTVLADSGDLSDSADTTVSAFSIPPSPIAA